MPERILEDRDTKLPYSLNLKGYASILTTMVKQQYLLPMFLDLIIDIVIIVVESLSSLTLLIVLLECS